MTKLDIGPSYSLRILLCRALGKRVYAYECVIGWSGEDRGENELLGADGSLEQEREGYCREGETVK